MNERKIKTMEVKKKIAPSKYLIEAYEHRWCEGKREKVTKRIPVPELHKHQHTHGTTGRET